MEMSYFVLVFLERVDNMSNLSPGCCRCCEVNLNSSRKGRGCCGGTQQW